MLSMSSGDFIFVFKYSLSNTTKTPIINPNANEIPIILAFLGDTALLFSTALSIIFTLFNFNKVAMYSDSVSLLSEMSGESSPI